MAETADARLVSGDAATPVGGVTQDTRRLQPGDLFVAVPGLRARRPGVRAAGARPRRGGHRRRASPHAASWPDVPLRRWSATRAAPWPTCRPPSTATRRRHLPVVGVTGTDGKTSTTHLLSAILEAHGLRTGWLTTVSTRIGAELRSNATDNTTPEAPVVQRALAEMRRGWRRRGHRRDQLARARARTGARRPRFEVGVFTNLSPEHLNFHGTLRGAIAPPRPGCSSACRRRPGGAERRRPEQRRHARGDSARASLTYGLDQPADCHGHRYPPVAERHDVRARSQAASQIRTRLVGRFNVSNWLAAYAAATCFGATPSDLVARRGRASRPCQVA